MMLPWQTGSHSILILLQQDMLCYQNWFAPQVSKEQCSLQLQSLYANMLTFEMMATFLFHLHGLLPTMNSEQAFEKSRKC